MLGPHTSDRSSFTVEQPATPKPERTTGQGVDLWELIQDTHRGALFPKIAVPVDGSPPSMRALQLAIELAKVFHSSLTLVTVIPPPPSYGVEFLSPETWADITKAYRDEMEKLAATTKKQGITSVTTECREGVVVDQLLEFFNTTPVDLIVMGSRGLSPSRRLILGSVSDALVHHAPCPVLVVRNPLNPGGPTTAPPRPGRKPAAK